MTGTRAADGGGLRGLFCSAPQSRPEFLNFSSAPLVNQSMFFSRTGCGLFWIMRYAGLWAS